MYSKFYAHYNKMDELNNLFIIFQYNQYFRKNLKTLLKNIDAKKNQHRELKFYFFKYNRSPISKNW